MVASPGRDEAVSLQEQAPANQAAARSRTVAVLFLLFAAGWATNHFVALMPALSATGRFDGGSLETAFGVYALGLLPSLLTGGAIADRYGAKPIALVGTLVATLGNVGMLLWPEPLLVTVGRFVVGIGVGLTISAGSAWVASMRPQNGASIAGTVLTFGFGLGPFFSGLIWLVASPAHEISLPLIVTIAVSLAVFVWVLVAVPRRGSGGSGGDAGAAAVEDPMRSMRRALVRALPMSLWVFASAAMPMVVLSPRLEGGFEGPVAAGTMAAATLGASVITQAVATRLRWGSLSGACGALLAAGGFALSALLINEVTLSFVIVSAAVFGAAFGLCMKNGLTDIATYAPVASRGLTVGIFYVGAYLGFGLPRLLEGFRPSFGLVVPLLACAVLALLTAALRVVQLRSAARDTP